MLITYLITLLILFFLILIFFQIYLSLYNKNLYEGLENNNDEVIYSDDALILAQKNAGNLLLLKDQIDSCDCKGTNDKITDLSNQINTLQNKLDNLVNDKTEEATNIISDVPTDIN